ncbi:mucin-19-like isoform X2 [Bombus huntii]|uniref:mucin-19-like isoform X2 n=1 Tax=Bombus huntii TaxID=85661 RepID=UPI0021AA3962|nr:mucin-19-like isoform X2 [Bombus huntii]
MINRTCLAVLIGLLGLACGLQCPKQKLSPGREVVCYTFVSDVDQLTEAVCKCTSLVQQGYDVRNLSVSGFEDFQKSLKKIIPTLQFVVSVDDPGKTLSTSGTVRQEITARLIGVLKEVDGVELNMTAGSKERLVHFVKGLKDELVRKSYDKRIFLVLPTKSEELAKQFDLKELTKYVDLFTVPTHYLVEDDEANHTFHPSRLMGLFDMFNADSLIDLISGLGAPKRKILVSVPASAYKFTLKDQNDNAPRASTEEMQPVTIDQKQLCDLMNNGEWTVERDEDLTAPYAFKDKMWIAFEDRISLSIKGKYVLLRDLPGLAVHNVENDFKTNCGMSLTHEVHRSFSNFKRKSRAAVLNALEDDLHQKELEYSTKVKSSDFRVVRVVDTEGHIRVVRENTQTEFTCSRQGYFVHPKSCNRFYRCVKFNQEVEDYSVFEFDCPAGLSFDERTEVCVWPGSMPEGSPCPGSSEIAPVTRIRFECPSKSGYYADPQNPRWFFACIDLGGPEIMAYEFRCPFGLIFDEQKLICEWPWLVAGYSGTGYTRSEYDGGYYGTGTTAGTGGYYTGALPHGYTGTSGGGGYTVSTGSGFSGAAGVGHGSSFGQGTKYTGSGKEKGYSGSGQGAGYTGSGVAGHGTSYDGQGADGYSGTTGSGYSGATGAGHGTTYSGQGSGGYSGTTGSGYSGAAGAGHGTTYSGQGSGGYSGTTGSGYSTGGAGYGTKYTGQGFGGHSGTTVSGYSGTAGVGHGSTYSGQGSGRHSGTTGGEYAGAAEADHGTPYTGQGFTGTTGSGYSSAGATITSGHGYSGTGTSYTGSTGKAGYGGSIGTGYSRGTGTGQVSTGTGFTGAGIIEQTEKSGTTGTGYTGSTYSAAGSTDGRYSGTKEGSISGGYPGTKSGSSGGGYSGATGGTTGGYAGPGGIYGGSTGGGYVGSTAGGYTGAGTTGAHAGSTGGYAGPGGIHGGSTGGGYVGSTAGGYTGAGTTGAHAGSTGGYTGPGGIHGGSTGGGYVGSTAGGYTGAGTTGAHAGSTGGYAGPGGIHGGSTGGGFAGSTAGGYTGAGITGAHAGSTGGYTGTSGGYGGTSIPGQTITFGTGQSRTPIFVSSGTTGAGVDHGVTSIYSQTPGPIIVEKPEKPTCLTNLCYGSSQPSGGQTLVTDDYVSSHGATSGTNVYQGTTGFPGSLNVTFGSHVPSIGGVTYHGGVTPAGGYTVTTGTGAIVTGHGIQGSIITGDSTPGTLITHGATPGAIFTGSSDQGTIISGGSHPGYTKTGLSSPGYVISGGVKTVFPGSVSSGTTVYGTPSPGVIVTGTPSPGVVVTGTPSPGTIIKGQSSPGIILTGQTAPGVSIGGSIVPGTVIGSGFSTHPGAVTPGSPFGTKIGTTPSTYVTGYKTNEYHDNGGRGTIRFNNGDVTTKYTENDIPDYRPIGGNILPDTLIPGSKGIPGVSLPSGFTKTGPTKTGFTTATLGAGGSYVISTGKTNPPPNPDHIGAKAFEGNVAGYPKSSTESSAKTYSGTFSTYGPGFSQKPSKGTGYSYPTPSIPFDTGVTKNLPISSTESGIFSGTTPTPFLKVEVHNTPKFDEAGFTSSPAVVNTYQKPSGFTRAPSPTGTPVLYTTGPLENYKTTVFEAAKVPVTISTIHPVIDTGYQTVISSTPLPVTISQDKFSIQTKPQFGFGTKTSQPGIFGDRGYVSSTTPTTVFKITSKYPSGEPQYDYGPTTPSSGSGYFTTSKNVFEHVTPSGISESPKPQTQYIPGESISPAIGVTYRKPFPLPGVTYQQEFTPASVKSYTTAPSGIGSGPGYKGSPTNIAIPRDEVGKLVTNYNRGTTKYVPSQYDVYTTGSAAGVDYYQSQTKFKQGYDSSTPSSVPRTQSPLTVTTYSGGYSKPSSGITYQTTAKSTAVGKPKVIVKWSDLHPLLLGKLGAECTCRGDPFANLRGPGSKLINSSKGKVDLSNYDESEIYVDLEKEGSYEDQDYQVTNYESSSKQPVKIYNELSKALGATSIQVQEKPSSTYLPSVTPSVGVGGRTSGLSSHGLTANFRSGKSLSNVGSPINSIGGGKGLASTVDHSVIGPIDGSVNSPTDDSIDGPIDRSGEYEDSVSEEIIDGATNCARPGLFRHPNFCNKFYACHWDEWKKKFTLHTFNCPVHLTFDNGAGACNWPSMGPACQDNNLLV